MSSRKAAQEPVEQLDDQITEMIYGTPETPNYLRIGFLRGILDGIDRGNARLVRDNPDVAVHADAGEVILVIAEAEFVARQWPQMRRKRPQK